jgi:hypothetical protein
MTYHVPDPDPWPNDADMLMAEATEAANLAAAGVCPACEDPLDPMAAQWDSTDWGNTPRDALAEHVGPHSNVVDGYHDRCIGL